MDQNMGMDMPEQNGSSSGMGMQMVFYWGKRVELMFPGWSPNTLPKYLLSLLALFGLAFFNQSLHYLRKRIVDPIHATNNGKDVGIKSFLISIAETLVFTVYAGTGYLLMLAVMSYNVGVFLAILAGLSVGFFVFRVWRRSDGLAEISANHTAH